MAQFDVFKVSSTHDVLAIEIQSDLLGELDTTVVIPLVLKPSIDDEALSTLHPCLIIDGQDYIMRTAELSSVRRVVLSDFVANVEGEYRDVIIASIDFLISGF